MKRASLLLAFLLLPIGWALAAAGLGMVGHMAGHMIAVALAAPLLAYGLGAGAFDPAKRWPRIVTPMAMMLVELLTIWLWHLPLLRAAVEHSPIVMAIEQAQFLIAGWLLWASVFHAPQRMAGIGALLLTSMHMTLLGVLIGLAPRSLYGVTPHGLHALDPVTDQQLGGVIMLLIGAASYFIGGLAVLGSIIRERKAV